MESTIDEYTISSQGLLDPLMFYTESIKPYCYLCEQPFESTRGLRLHEGRVHTNFEKTLKCHKCSKMFKTKYSLQIHERQVHDRTTRLNCPKCGKELYNKYMLKNHNKKHHPAQVNID